MRNAVWVVFVVVGCSKPAVPPPTASTDSPIESPLTRLETQRDPASCKELLQYLDNRNLPRTAYSPAMEASLRQAFKLDDNEWFEISSPASTPTDADYLADCLLLRDAIHGLDLESDPPAVQAERLFAWTCRQVYRTQTIFPPVPIDLSLAGGYGHALDRAYICLALWQQRGLDGCLIGPPTLADRPWLTNGKPPEAAPVRAIGVRVGEELLLFDPVAGVPLGRTLKQVQAGSTAIPGIPATEVASWMAFAAPPMMALAPRMKAYETALQTTEPVKLAIDAFGLRERLRKVAGRAEFWSVRDGFTPTRLTIFYSGDAKTLRENYTRRLLPLAFLPRLEAYGRPLEGRPLAFTARVFFQPFDSLRFVPNSPRDQLLRGKYVEAIATLGERIQRADAERARPLPKDWKETTTRWAEAAVDAYAIVGRADDADAQSAAEEALTRLNMDPSTKAVARYLEHERAKLFGAEASYLLALADHERAENASAHPDRVSPAERLALWKNAVGSWERYRNNYRELRSAFAERDAHAEGLLIRARAMAK